jgi:hypothetical protein
VKRAGLDDSSEKTKDRQRIERIEQILSLFYPLHPLNPLTKQRGGNQQGTFYPDPLPLGALQDVVRPLEPVFCVCGGGGELVSIIVPMYG